ncbi:MAG: bifunctional pyr operon transcriptional regulator/uracil phosphoribosyltransferase PyrR [Myxococcales bacterium]|nr:bifunctional pyr operon transcriptional regulator/uracil phosphoribosyltransferase PyrR [Myxococcales bacterium]
MTEVLLDADAIGRAIRRMASEIVEASRGAGSLAIVGIRRGGVVLSERLAAAVAEQEGTKVPTGLVDIAFYRDDAATALPDPKIGPSHLPFDPTGMDVVLVDDVLQTGRTVRAAIDCLLDYGRPRRVWLAALLDRGGRELPIAADFLGRRIEVAPGAKVRVELGETDRAWLQLAPSEEAR